MLVIYGLRYSYCIDLLVVLHLIVLLCCLVIIVWFVTQFSVYCVAALDLLFVVLLIEIWLRVV